MSEPLEIRQKFGQLTIIRRLAISGYSFSNIIYEYEVECGCGMRWFMTSENLLNGLKTNCGYDTCKRKEEQMI